MVEASFEETGVASCAAAGTGTQPATSAAPALVASARPTTPRRVIATAGACRFSGFGARGSAYSPTMRLCRPSEDAGRSGNCAAVAALPLDRPAVALARFEECLTLSWQELSVNSTEGTEVHESGLSVYKLL